MDTEMFELWVLDEVTVVRKWNRVIVEIPFYIAVATGPPKRKIKKKITLIRILAEKESLEIKNLHQILSRTLDITRATPKYQSV